MPKANIRQVFLMGVDIFYHRIHYNIVFMEEILGGKIQDGCIEGCNCSQDSCYRCIYAFRWFENSFIKETTLDEYMRMP